MKSRQNSHLLLRCLQPSRCILTVPIRGLCPGWHLKKAEIRAHLRCRPPVVEVWPWMGLADRQEGKRGKTEMWETDFSKGKRDCPVYHSQVETSSCWRSCGGKRIPLAIVLWDCSRPKVFLCNLTSFYLVEPQTVFLFLTSLCPLGRSCFCLWSETLRKWMPRDLTFPEWIGRPREIRNRLSQNPFPGSKLPFSFLTAHFFFHFIKNANSSWS